MTLTTRVHVNWPVPAERLLDVVTVAAGGDLDAIERHQGRDSFGTTLGNHPGQGLLALCWVRWSERPDTGDVDCPEPPGLVSLAMDSPYGLDAGTVEGSAARFHASVLLPAVVLWLDDQGVPRDRWWWLDEFSGTWHPGTTDVALLADEGPRETWSAA